MYKSIKSFLLGCALLLCVMSYAAEPQTKKVTVLLSSDATPYQITLQGFKDQMLAQNIKANISMLSMQGNKDNSESVLAELNEQAPDLILTLGTLATKISLTEISTKPTIVSMVLNSKAIDESANATGIVLNHSFDTQINWLKTILPKAKTIAVLYNPKQNQARLDELSSIAKAKGLKVEAIEVNEPRDLPYALKKISNNADVIFGLSDRVVLSKKTSEEVLLTSFRNRIPFVGLSNNWVKAGALYSLGWDYQDIGAQSAELAIKILNGQLVQNIKVAPARKVTYSINQKAVEHMKLELDKAIIEQAQKVYQ